MKENIKSFIKPSLDEFCRYIESHGFDLNPYELYKEFDSTGWRNRKGEITKSWFSLVAAKNSVVCRQRENDKLMAVGIPKGRKHESKQNLRQRISKARTRIVKMHYKDFLQDERWLAFRKFVFAVRGCKCEDCGSHEYLQIHHTKYKDGLRPWEYTCNDVVVLCRNCHAKIHGKEK